MSKLNVKGSASWASNAGLVSRAAISMAALSVASFGALNVVAPQQANAQASLINGLGGNAGYGDNGSCLSPNDDGSSASINISSIFPDGMNFFGTTHNSIFVNTNGNITFSNRLSSYTPTAFPVANQPMIAPYWADVDIRNNPEAGYACQGSGGITCTVCSPCHNPSQNGVWYDLDGANERIIVTWDRVGHYNCERDERMSFQLILSNPADGCTTPGDFDVEFRFNLCQWEAGSASGDSNGNGLCGGGENSCVPAQSGFDAGDQMNFVALPGSRQNGINTRMCGESNVGTPGVWRFEVRDGAITPEAGDCDTGLLGVCADGHIEFIGAGEQCVQNIEASDEVCDGLDNDCDGSTDEDGDLCGDALACDNGICVEACEPDKCPISSDICNEDTGLCSSTSCDGINCPDGEVCAGGACIDPCEGVSCPFGQECNNGFCNDLCLGVACSECGVCIEGACEITCQEVGCGAGETCQPDGVCVPNACAGIVCDDGAHCEGGNCIDDCLGVVCPRDFVCRTGQCQAPLCGNGDLDAGEVCDDGNTDDRDGCAANCLSDESCGNDIIDTRVNETCDDGNRIAGDGCSVDCLSNETCGNRTVDFVTGEVCDDGGFTSGDGCSGDCMSDESCGNNIFDGAAGEVCDDGNSADGDGCSADCLSDEVCGNNVVDTNAGEACDDGNLVGGDGCSAGCDSDETCGNGVFDGAAGEACDDGNNVDGDGCEADCSLADCGDGVLDDGEACDDGNNDDGDGCSANCASDETCGNGFQDEGEACDDGDTNSDTAADACRVDCSAAMCGDNVVDTGEECDDGEANSENAMTGGCSLVCTIVTDGGDVGTDTGGDAGTDADNDTTTGDDTGESDTNTDDDTTTGGDATGDTGLLDAGGEGGTASDSGCGCSSTAPTNRGVGALAGLAVFGLLRRRRR